MLQLTVGADPAQSPSLVTVTPDWRRGVRGWTGGGGGEAMWGDLSLGEGETGATRGLLGVLGHENED